MANYKLYTLNCHGLNNPVKLRRLTVTLHKEHLDIMFLQETHIKHSTSRILSSHRFLHQFHAPGSSKARGVATLISKDLQFSEVSILRDPEGRFLFLNCIIDAKPYTLATLYAPNVDQLKFLDVTFRKLANFKTGVILLGGDLNYVCDSLLDRTRPPGNPHSRSQSGSSASDRPLRSRVTRGLCRTDLVHIFKCYDLVEAWRALYPSALQYTFFHLHTVSIPG